MLLLQIRKVREEFSKLSITVLVEVEDEGFGFDHERLPDGLTSWEEQQPRGRGLFLMRSYTTWLNFNPTGNRVTLCRRKSESRS